MNDAVTGFIDAMKTQPLALAMVVMNVALLALFYAILQSGEHRHKMDMEQLNHIHDILSKCVVPSGTKP